MTDFAYMVASRSPIIVDGRPAAPGDQLPDFDAESESGKRHLESGAVVKVELASDDDGQQVDPPDDEPDPQTAADPPEDQQQPKPRRRRRPTPEDNQDD